MAEEIVACPGCGKKFRIPEGAPGGTFQCTACNASVPYGKAAQKPGAKPAAAKAAPASRPAARGAAAHAAHGARASHGAAARHGARHGRGEPEEPEETGHGHRHKPDRVKRDQQLVLWLGVGGIAVVAVGAVFLLNRKPSSHTGPQQPQPVAQQPQPVPVPVAPSPEPAPAAAPAAQPPASPAPSSAGDGAKPQPASGIGGAGTSSSSTAGWSSDPAVLYVRYPDVEGVTPQEREALDRDVVLLCDRESAKAGVDARNRLKKQGRRAVAPLISAFESHWKGSKWESDAEKFASYQIQQLLMEITKADRPRDFLARFDPRVPVPAKDFEQAAKMWTNWWNTKGKTIEKFKDFAD